MATYLTQKSVSSMLRRVWCFSLAEPEAEDAALDFPSLRISDGQSAAAVVVDQQSRSGREASLLPTAPSAFCNNEFRLAISFFSSGLPSTDNVPGAPV